MSHMVIYRSVDGKPGFQQTDDLVAAVEFVERLRNLEGVESARIYRLEQLNFRFQPYFQVHLDTGNAPEVPRPLVSPDVAGSSTGASAPVAPQSAPLNMSESAPVPPRVLSAALAAASAEAHHGPTIDVSDSSAPSLGFTPTDDQADSTGIRRGLFGR